MRPWIAVLWHLFRISLGAALITLHGQVWWETYLAMLAGLCVLPLRNFVDVYADAKRAKGAGILDRGVGR